MIDNLRRAPESLRRAQGSLRRAGSVCDPTACAGRRRRPSRNSPNSVTPSMPANTVTPVAERTSAGAAGEHERNRAGDERDRGHHDGP